MLRDKPIPLYYQLETILRRKILSGELPVHAHLPSEEALAEEYGVSRITVRQALAALERDGLVVRQRGKGTFVAERSDQLDLPHFTGSIEDLVLMGMQTKFQLIDMLWIDPPEPIANKLNSRGSKVLRVEKVRHVHDGPLSHVLNYLPKHVGERLPVDILDTKPMMMILEEELGLELAEADQSVSATLADAEIATLLGIRAGDPLLKAERTIYDRDGCPVEVVTTLYRADKYSLVMKLKRRLVGNVLSWETI